MAGGWLLLAAASAGAGFGVAWGLCVRRKVRRERAGDSGAAGEQVMEIAALAGGLAHEIRNPLSTLKVNLQLLGEDWGDETVSVQDLRRRSLNRLETIQTEADRLHTIVDDFLRLIGRQELRLVPRDLNEVVRQFVEFYEPQAQANRVCIRMQLAEQPLVCRADEDLCKQILLNLCINAQEAMPQGGELTIRSDRSAPRMAFIEVSDTGAGLDAADVERIFEPYYSTKPHGTGLGLALTRRMVRAHGGTIAATSAPGHGTTFKVTFPLAAA